MQAKIWNHSGLIRETNPQELEKLFDRVIEPSSSNLEYFKAFVTLIENIK